MDQGDEEAGRLEAVEAARAEAEAAAEVAFGDATQGADAEPARSPVCPFLRLDRDGVLEASTGVVDVDHRCAALTTPVPVSEVQQSLVCLVASHEDCPRYLRGSNVVPIVEPVPRRSVQRPTLVAAAVLVASLAGSLAFAAANGGLFIPMPPATAPASAAVTASTTPSGTTPASSGTAPGPSAAPPSAAPPSTPAPSVATAPPASPVASAPAASAPAASGATADRLALLEPCPGRTDCYVYTVRQGDNLTSIGLFFGVPFDTILRLNPWIGDPTTIHKGDRVVLTTPTR